VNTVMNLRVPEWLHNWRLLKKGSTPWVSGWVNEWLYPGNATSN
jgi:hypothetical protein